MNNKTVLWVVAALLVLGIAYFAFARNKTSQAPAPAVQSSNQSQSQAKPANTPSSSPQSLKDLLAGGASTKCTFSDAGSTGTFYVSGGKSRGDFTATVNGKAMGSHMIMDGKTSYIWTDGQTQGFKMSVDAAATATAKDQAAAQQSFDANKKLNYSCSAWSADSAMFSLPAGVQFTDMSAMLQKK